MEHNPFCVDILLACRTCGCAKEWHPLDGRCWVGPETEFTVFNCGCQKYIPRDNLLYLEWLYNKNVSK